MGHQVFLYRKDADGKVEARIFDSDSLPKAAEGWTDSPTKVVVPVAPKPKAKG